MTALGWPAWDDLPTPAPKYRPVAGVDYLAPVDLELDEHEGADYSEADLDLEGWAPRRAARRTHAGEHEDLTALVGVRPGLVERRGGVA